MADLDGDGYDDETGEAISPYDEAWDRAGRGDDTTPEGADYYANLDQEEYARQRQIARDRGQRWGEQTAYGQGGGGGPSEFDAATADIPILGWLFGSSARRDAATAAQREAQNKSEWAELSNWMPTADDLAVTYDEENFIAGPEGSELSGARADSGAMGHQAASLDALADIADDGMTAADRAQMAIGREEIGRDVRAGREADQAALAARGMGSSGASIASMMGNQQAGASALSQADAAMQVAAQQRRLQAQQARGAMAGQARGQSFDEESTRRGAADDFARYQADYARDREERNARWRNRTRESRADARQTAYQNRERQTAGSTGQYQGDQSRRLAEGQRQDENNAGLLAGLAEIINW